MPQKDDDVMKIGMSCWFCVCILLVLWFVNKFMQGRSRLSRNMNVVEEGLKKMQAQLEDDMRRKNSKGSLENFDDIFKDDDIFRDDDSNDEETAKKVIFEKAHEMLRTYTEEELENEDLKKTV